MPTNVEELPRNLASLCKLKPISLTKFKKRLHSSTANPNNKSKQYNIALRHQRHRETTDTLYHQAKSPKKGSLQCKSKTDFQKNSVLK